MDVANHDVPLPKNRHRRFRIIVREVTALQESQLMELTRRVRAGKETEREEIIAIQRRPFRIDRIEFWYNSSQEQRRGDVKAPYPVTDFKVEQNEPAHQMVIEVRSRREPLTALSLESLQPEFPAPGDGPGTGSKGDAHRMARHRRGHDHAHRLSRVAT